jgi:hypothetical protein
MTSTQQFLRPAYEPGDGSQFVNGEWYMPVYGCDSLQVFIEQLPYKLTPEFISQVAKDVGDGNGKAIFDEEAFATALLGHLLHPLHEPPVVHL